MNAKNGTYHTLLARHEAMRLRRQLLSPGPTAPAAGRDTPYAPAGTAYDGTAYDGPADQQTILRHLDKVTPFDELITHLYRALFARHPSLRSLFPASMEFQQAHLARALWYLIEHLHRPDDVARTFMRLGRDHRKLGLLPAQYTAFETALREALRVRAGAGWTVELEQAWLRMLRFGVTAMVRGAEAALREPPFWRATVTDHQLLAPDLALLRLRPHEAFPHRAGQYVTLEVPRLPHTWRPFYPAGAYGTEGDLELHVRRTGVGGVSDALVNGTAVGDEIRIGPPRGDLTLHDGPQDRLHLVAWDTGWSAMKALIQELDRRTRAAPAHRVGAVRLHIGAETLAGLYDTDCLTELERRHPWLTVVPVIDTSQARACDRLVHELTRHPSHTAVRILMAGPPALVHTLTAALTHAGTPAEHLCHDLPPNNPDAPRPAAVTVSATSRHG
ncbi:globin domain-containing protein [Streptomyces sp. 2-6]|uniref:globin domain-containing protein n=1 Tax=Streptomyces sp. 2-6 TaxID=2978333 RepID=UPI003D0DF536